MTREEAIKDLDIIRFNPHWDELVNEEYWKELMEMAIKALEEVQQYRQIGTVEECRAAMEKQKAKKPEFVDTRFMNNGKHISDGCQLQKCYKCPNCNQHIFHVWDDELYCKYCGQLLDWSDEV